MEVSVHRDGQLFSKRDLVRLVIPLLVEQCLVVLIGMVGSLMVSHLGETQFSAVSLVDNINLLWNQVFAALATGGSVIAAQYLGHSDQRRACDAARQLFYISALVGLLLGAVSIAFGGQILNLCFGQVLEGCSIYFLISAFSYPFIGIYSAGAAVYRAMARSKVTMFVSLIMNVVNVLSNFLTIYVFGWGVAGAATSALLARVTGAVVYMILIQKPVGAIFIHDLKKVRLDFSIIKRILHIGVPTGLENGMFQIGKLMVLRLIGSLGVASIAANQIMNSTTSLFMLPGNALSLALVTVVGMCMGAGKPDQAQRYTWRLILLSCGSLLLTMLPMALLAPQVAQLFRPSPEAKSIAVSIARIYAPFTVVFWPLSFILPSALRSAGDVRYTMVISVLSMFIMRVALSFLFVQQLGMGAGGVWLAMYADWIVRTAFFVPRFLKGKWKTLRVI